MSFRNIDYYIPKNIIPKKYIKNHIFVVEKDVNDYEPNEVFKYLDIKIIDSIIVDIYEIYYISGQENKIKELSQYFKDYKISTICQ